MIQVFDIGFAKLFINITDGTGNALFGNNLFPVSDFEYAPRKLLSPDRTKPSVRFKVVQTIPELHRSPFTATIEAELVVDSLPLSLVPEKVQPSARDTYVSQGDKKRPKAFHEGLWDGFHCTADDARAEADPAYRAGVEEGFARYLCDAPI